VENSRSLTRKIGTDYTMISVFPIIICVASAISGFGRGTNAVAAITGIIVLLLNSKIRIRGNIGKSIISFIIFYSVQFVHSTINIQSMYYYIMTNIVWSFLVFIPLFIENIIYNADSTVLSNKLLKWFAILWGILVIFSIYTFSKAEIGGREYAQNSRGLLLGGGYPVAYSSAILTVVLLHYILYSSLNKKMKILLIGMVIVSVTHVFFTMSVITVFALIAGVITSFLFHGDKKHTRNKQIKSFIVIAILLGLTIYGLMNIKQIGLWMINISGNISNDIFSYRIKELGMALFSNEETYHMGLRLNTLTSSISTFLQHPIFGVAYRVGNTYDLLNSVGVGTHSDILDSLAKFGIVGAIPLFLIYVYQIREIRSRSRMDLGTSLWVTILVLSGFNPFISIQTSFMLFIFVPLIIDKMEEKLDQQNSER